jgi:sterol desaturase/sphingolipid hydroxylase (fatty acid hydroxylase superfamily)
VHPFEFFVGEYLHLFTVCVIPCHIVAVGIFLMIGGVLASLNHTRFDVEIPYIYCVRVHDVHHRLPESNYGQYIMLWDHIFGSYRAYNNTTSIVNNKDDYCFHSVKFCQYIVRTQVI